MKIIDLPTRVYESGDKVMTPDGLGTVLHDELEGVLEDYAGNSCDQFRAFDKPGRNIRKEIAEHSHERDAVIVRLDKPKKGREEGEYNRSDVFPIKTHPKSN